MKQLSLALLLVLAPAVCFGQAIKKIPVAVNHSNSDQVGQTVASALKESIRVSESFRLVDDEPAPKTPRIVIRLVSVEWENSGDASSISEAIVYDDSEVGGHGLLLQLMVQYCGRDRAEACATNMLPVIGQAVEYLRTSLPSLWKSL